MDKKISCTLSVKEVNKNGYIGYNVVLETPKGTKVQLGYFNLNRKLVYKLVCEVEGK